MTGDVDPRLVLELLRTGPAVANLGVREFAESVRTQGAPVLHIEWRPPPQLDGDLAELLERLG